MESPTPRPELTPRVPVAKPESVRYLLSLGGLALLPLLPELYLCLRTGAGLKVFAPIAYYECIVSYGLLAPALMFNRAWSRVWVGLIGTIMAVATVIALWQPVSVGARWDSTAHTALFQTNPGVAWSYLRAFVHWREIAWILLLLGGFAVCLGINLRAAFPPRRIAWGGLSVGLLLSSYGLHNIVRYDGWPFHEVPMGGGKTLQVAEMGLNKYHPVTLLAVTHYNFKVTLDFYLQSFRRVAEHSADFQGAVPVPGATMPRVMVVVVGESASRRHWSMYGYRRETNPRLKELADELLLFTDVIAPTVGTQDELRAMFTTDFDSLPAFPLFSATGYKTHWLSAQFNQRASHVMIASLIQSCGERRFLSGAYDEELLPFVQKAADEPGRHIIFLHFFGSHVRYQDRYPASFAVFHGQSEDDRRLAAYDNSIRYTDHVLAELIEMLRRRKEVSCLLYLSDHAEDVYDTDPDKYLFRSDALATNAMYEVPFLAWFSPEYRRDNPGFVEAAAQGRNREATTTRLYHNLIDLARFTHPMYDSRRSVFSPDFVAQPRFVGAMKRVYVK